MISLYSKKYITLALMIVLSAFFLVGCSSISSSYEAGETEDIILLPLKVSGSQKYGYINTSGDWVIEPQYTKARAFSEGLAVANDVETGHYGYINTAGDWAIEPQYSYVESFSEGFALVYKSESGMCFIDKTGTVSAQLGDILAYSLSDGLANAIEPATKLEGYVDSSGNWIIEPQFSEAYDFVDGLALASDDSGEYGYINTSGDWVIEPQYSEAFSFSEGLAFVKKKKDQYGYIDTAGNWAIAPTLYYGSSFSDGLAAVPEPSTSESKYIDTMYWGFINASGDWVIEPQFVSKGGMFSEGFAAINQHPSYSNYAYIDKEGNFITEYQFDEADPFRNGYARVVFLDEATGVNEENYINTNGEFVKSIDSYHTGGRFDMR